MPDCLQVANPAIVFMDEPTSGGAATPLCACQPATAPPGQLSSTQHLCSLLLTLATAWLHAAEPTADGTRAQEPSLTDHGLRLQGLTPEQPGSS